MSPLAHEIYRQLLRHLRSGKASITYAELATAVGKKHPTHQRSQNFHKALGEVTAACRDKQLPLLPAIVWKAGTSMPSTGYFKAAHPRVKSEEAQIAAWEREHAAVVRDAAAYPPTL